jgi:hypothetical protein
MYEKKRVYKFKTADGLITTGQVINEDETNIEVVSKYKERRILTKKHIISAWIVDKGAENGY